MVALDCSAQQKMDHAADEASGMVVVGEVGEVDEVVEHTLLFARSYAQSGVGDGEFHVVVLAVATACEGDLAAGGESGGVLEQTAEHIAGTFEVGLDLEVLFGIYHV